jgi:hypothetical protein
VLATTIRDGRSRSHGPQRAHITHERAHGGTSGCLQMVGMTTHHKVEVVRQYRLIFTRG